PQKGGSHRSTGGRPLPAPAAREISASRPFVSAAFAILSANCLECSAIVTKQSLLARLSAYARGLSFGTDHAEPIRGTTRLYRAIVVPARRMDRHERDRQGKPTQGEGDGGRGGKGARRYLPYP